MTKEYLNFLASSNRENRLKRILFYQDALNPPIKYHEAQLKHMSNQHLNDLHYKLSNQYHSIYGVDKKWHV